MDTTYNQKMGRHCCSYMSFDLRIYLLQGWYIPCYALKIYHLNLFLAFLTPKIDPAIAAAAEENAEDDGLELPTRHNDEFRPFTRRLPEWIFWKKATRSKEFCTPFFAFAYLEPCLYKKGCQPFKT